MAHIASCMLDVDTDSASSSYIAKPSSPLPPNETMPPSSSSSTAEHKPFVWRMHHPETRKYQLFPKDRQRPTGKSLDPEQAFALAMGQNEKTEKPCSSSGSLRLRIKEHNLIRRRKVSIPELGPMTTVQEVPMDSPTIPGRPPLHERSISAPGHHLKQHRSTGSTSSVTAPDTDSTGSTTPARSPERHQRSASENPNPRPPISPKQLAPLVIPTHIGNVPRLARQVSHSRMRSGSNGHDASQLSARADDSPRSQSRTPFTPLTASTALTTPLSACPSFQSATTPVSAPLMENRSSPKPWENGSTPTATAPGLSKEVSSPEAGGASRAFVNAHRRGQSESGSIMDRGRPRKRSDVRNNNGPLLKRSASTRNTSAERRAFEELPTGWRASEAPNHIEQDELACLQKQAFGQASRFEVLRKEDVELLSKELRQLDERCEYLRRTYNSLRAGRRNLHSRICQYLRSPRMAKFSTDSMLKQEEALAELDTSIDDWVGKLEQAENRRTRVRQKLLEHVAAAATLPTPATTAASESLQLAMGIRSAQAGVGNISTPPRSPTKNGFSSHTTSSSPSPQRVVAQVPSTIVEQPVVEESADNKHVSALNHRRGNMESIRIYADSDVYALFADVENEITKMSAAATQNETPANLSDDERREIHRARSHEALSGACSADAKSPVPSPQAAPSPTTQDSPADGEAIFLTSAVFRG
ncbi:hypothetical protein CSOJ01_01862 [Colletotrichum sojae]|uniref:Up-regulated during septation protein 1 domain-containing protein n=1 Tax=Colletotrichum sojae TaxID=2175907 RepID=A0A8H6JSW3_9PEZI|nr:hypothetical protein CSOJ01_01862 [Colletotrichum sojae]